MYVSYNREYLSFKDVRISIDTNITYKFDTNFETKDNRVIAELKTSINKDIDELNKGTISVLGFKISFDMKNYIIDKR